MRSHSRFMCLAAIGLLLCALAPRARGDTANSAVRDAQKQVNEAQSDLHKASIDLARLMVKLRSQIQATPEWKEASAKALAARSSYQSKEKSARDSLRDQPAYKAAVAERTRLREERDALKASPTPPQDKVTEIAIAVLKSEAAVTRLELDAIAADPKVAEARADLAQANAKLTEVQNRLAGEHENDADYLAARQRVDAAKVRVADAQKQVNQAKQQQAQAEDQQLDQDLALKRQQLRNGSGFAR